MPSKPRGEIKFFQDDFPYPTPAYPEPKSSAYQQALKVRRVAYLYNSRLRNIWDKALSLSCIRSWIEMGQNTVGRAAAFDNVNASLIPVQDKPAAYNHVPALIPHRYKSYIGVIRGSLSPMNAARIF